MHFERMKCDGRRFGMLHQYAFCEFEIEIARFQAGFF